MKKDPVSVKTPSKISTPAFLMNFPFTLSTRDPNNVWMENLSSIKREIVQPKAFAQFLKVYHEMAKKGLVYLLPSEGDFQDQVYVANLGIYLPHIPDREVILISKFKSTPRIGEDKMGKKFFKSMGYETHQSPFHWEGEADLKFLKDNIYIGGYGIRSDIKTHDWMRDTFDMKIISVQMQDPRLYHLDTICFPISHDKIFLVTSALTKQDVKAIEKVAEIIEIPEMHKYESLTNTVRVGETLFCCKEQLDTNKKKRKQAEKFFTDLCNIHSLEPLYFEMSEFEKSGAAMSCLFMHLNYLGRSM